uniref:Aminopeptidase n=1 Tax=Caldilinea aerophila TaxID=133453 RepID=A0A7C1FK98_9CHLR
MTTSFNASFNVQERLDRYADLLIRTGVNLQPRQGLLIRAELGHAPLVRAAIAAAYKAGASYVYVEWVDQPSTAAMLTYADVNALELPAFEIERFRYLVDAGWARLSLVGDEFPKALAAVEPNALRTWTVKRARAIKFYTEAMMANRLQWCVAGVPTPAWAQEVFPDRPAEEAVEALWEAILRMTRADQPDPPAAWNELNRRLKSVAAFLQRNQVQTLHFVDPVPGPDGKPATDLYVGLAEGARWVGGAAQTPAGIWFQPNVPSEEVFSMPHNRRTQGYVRTSRPSFPMQREVNDAWFRFEDGEVVEFKAGVGQDVLAQFFEIEGARRLGEVALVDASSPIFQSGLLFHEILFDENAACHIAFGEAYPECIEGGGAMSKEELAARGANFSDTHVDFMIGTATMHIDGLCADGRTVTIMRDGRFTEEMLA